MQRFVAWLTRSLGALPRVSGSDLLPSTPGVWRAPQWQVSQDLCLPSAGSQGALPCVGSLVRCPPLP